MKKLSILLIAVMAFSIHADAQILNNIFNSAKQQAERSVEKQVDKKIDEGVTKLFNGKKKDQQQPAQEAGWVCPQCGKAGNTGNFCAECGAKRPDVAAAEAAQNAQAEAEAAAAAAMQQLAAQQAAQQAAMQTAAEEVKVANNGYAEQFAALQALGVLTPEELAHLMRVGKELEPLTDEQVEAWMMAHPDELAFFLSLQMKMAAAQYGGTNATGK